MTGPVKVEVVPPPSPLTREQVEAMTPAEMDERWDEVQAFLASYKKAKKAGT